VAAISKENGSRSFGTSLFPIVQGLFLPGKMRKWYWLINRDLPAPFSTRPMMCGRPFVFFQILEKLDSNFSRAREKIEAISAVWFQTVEKPVDCL